MISYAEIGQGEVVLEIGAGLGFLTELLSRRCKEVIAVEVDPKLLEILRERFSDAGNIRILEGDILKITVPLFSKVVSTPPYSISSPLLFWLLNRDFMCAIMVLQKEFGQRLTAKPNSRDYSRLTVVAHFRTDVEILDDVPRPMFWPAPKVGSVIVRLRTRRAPYTVKDFPLFLEILRILFSQRNKKVRSAIKPFLEGLNLPDKDAGEWPRSLPFTGRRVRELNPENFASIANELADRLRGEVEKRFIHLPPNNSITLPKR